MEKITGHQGDVQFKEVGCIPKHATKIDVEPLAYGELSGHVHIITGEAEMFTDGPFKYVKAHSDLVLQHTLESEIGKSGILPKADHYPVTLPKGKIYQFGIQKEYDPFEKVFNPVID